MTTIENITAASMAAAFKAELDRLGLTDVGCTAEVGDATYTIPGRELWAWESDVMENTNPAMARIVADHRTRLGDKHFELYTGRPWAEVEKA